MPRIFILFLKFNFLLSFECQEEKTIFYERFDDGMALFFKSANGERMIAVTERNSTELRVGFCLCEGFGYIGFFDILSILFLGNNNIRLFGQIIVLRTLNQDLGKQTVVIKLTQMTYIT